MTATETLNSQMHLPAQRRLRRAVMRAGEQMAVRGGKAPPVRRKHSGQFHGSGRALASSLWKYDYLTGLTSLSCSCSVSEADRRKARAR